MTEVVLDIRDLRTSLRLSSSTEVEILHGIDLTVRRGDVLGLIGESGSGKTMTGLSIMRLLPPFGHIRSKRLQFLTQELSELSDRQLRSLRGRRIAMVFQDPVGAFNPAKSIAWHLRLALLCADAGHIGSEVGPKKSAKERIVGLLKSVGIVGGQTVMRNYPHQLSGGMLQRVLIAMAIACEPDLIIADEPTTNLDALVEKQILDLFRDLLHRVRAAFLYITHDIAVAASLCNRIAVMYAGQIVEQGPTSEVFGAPRHPYTQGLLATSVALSDPGDRLQEIPGELPSPAQTMPGCLFEPRCGVALPRCTSEMPALVETDPSHTVRCVLCQKS